MTTLTAWALVAASLSATPQVEMLDFYSNSCMPCMRMNPVVSKMQRQGYPIRKVNVTQERDLSRQYGVTRIPTFVLVMNGREIGRIQGSTSEQELRNLFARIPRQPAENTAIVAAETPKSLPRTDVDLGVATKTADALVPGSGWSDKSQTIAAQEIAGQGITETSGERQSEPFPASVRIRVKEATGVNLGSGTVIESEPGKSIIVTCGHIFRDMKPEAEICVDVFSEQGEVTTLEGKLIKFDLEADLGLISVASADQLPVAHICKPASAPEQGNHVYCVGCSAGKPPTRLQERITQLNRYRGPENIECTGLPVQGRSGGGLFNTDHELIGICIAADKRDHRGLYTGLKAVHQMLEECQYAYLFNPESESPAQAFGGEALASSNTQADVPPFGNSQAANTQTGAAAAFPGTTQPDATSDAPTAAQLDAMRKAIASGGDSEVICIVRPLNDPQAASRVVIINRASPKFLSYLDGELDTQPKQTSKQIRYAQEKQYQERQSQQKKYEQAHSQAGVWIQGRVLRTQGQPARPVQTQPVRTAAIPLPQTIRTSAQQHTRPVMPNFASAETDAAPQRYQRRR